MTAPSPTTNDPPEPAPDVSRLLIGKPIEHPDEFIRELTGITAPWVQAFGVTRPWFRGMSKISFTLEPSLLRYRPRNLRHAEGNLLNLFRAYATRILPAPPTSQLEWLTVMQHHGAPTRVLDWTENAFAALFFAVRDFQYFQEPEESVVWILDPLQLTKLHGLPAQIVFSDDALLGAPIPVPFYPVHKSDRVGTQRGTFTVHPFTPQHSLVKLALEQLDNGRPSFLGGLRIRGNKRQFIRQALVDGFGSGEFTFFPDLDGLCRELRMRESLEGRG